MTTCFHCGQAAGPLVADQICLACTADATYGRMLYSVYRYLAPPESAGVGDEHRDDPTSSDWKVVINDFLPLANKDRGLYRRKIRSADNAQRYLDPGESVRPGDLGRHFGGNEDTIGTLYEATTADELPAGGLQTIHYFAYRRPLYASFPPALCLCPKRAALTAADGEPEAEVCLTCGRVWADVPYGDAEVTQETQDFIARAAASPEPTPCPCATVDILPAEVQETVLPPWEVRRNDINTVLGHPEAPPPRVRLKVKCKTCGLIYTAEAWHARKSAYPDLATSDRDMIRKALRGHAPGPGQSASMNRYLLKVHHHRWRTHLRKGVIQGLSEETAKAIDAEFDRALDQLKAIQLEKRWNEVDPVTAMDAIALVAYLKDALDLLEQTFKTDIEAAYQARFKAIDDAIKLHGGKAYFFGPEPKKKARYTDAEAPKPIPTPDENALVVVADALRPVYQLAFMPSLPLDDEDKKKAIEAANYDQVIQLVANLPGPLLEDYNNALLLRSDTSMGPDTVAILAAMLKHVSPYEDSYTQTEPPDLSDLPDAIKCDPFPTRSEVDVTRGPVVHVLTPGDEIQPWDAWNDEGKLRPVVSTIGRVIPGRAVLEAAAGPHEAIAGTSIYCRPIALYKGEVSTLDLCEPDAVREMFAYNRLAGIERSPDSQIMTVDAVAALATHRKDVEAAIRLLYTAARIEILDCQTADHILYVTIRTPLGPRRIAVPLPK